MTSAGELNRSRTRLSRDAALERLQSLIAQGHCRPVIVLSICFGLALMTRLWGIDITVTADEGYWMQRTLRFGAALERGDLRETLRIGHPGVTVMWIGLAGMGRDRARALSADRYQRYYILERAPTYLATLASARMAVALAASVLVTVAIGLAWRLLGAGPALVGGWLLVFDPFTTGMTRLLHVDALLGPLMTIAVLAALVHRQSGQSRYLVLSAVATGLALLTKPPAIVVGLMFVGVCAATAWRFPPLRRGTVVDIALWSSLVGLTFVVCWPAMWVDAVTVLRAVAAFSFAEGAQPHPGGVFFLGQTLSQDPGPLFYLVAFLVRLGVMPYVGLGCLLLLRRSDHRARPVLALVAYVLLFVAIMSLGAKKLDRYLLPALMVATLVAGVGLWSLARWTGRAAPATIVFCLGLHLWLFVTAQPYPIATYNPVLGGAESARQIMTIGWGEGLDQVTAYLNARRRADRLVVASNYPHVVRPRFRGTTHSLTRLPRQVTRVDYIVVYVSTAQRRNLSAWAQRVLDAQPPVFIAHVNETAYAWVFRVPADLERPTPSIPSDDILDDDEEIEEHP